MELTLQNKYDIKRVQNRLLAKTIAKILEKHSIPYEISFGTLPECREFDPLTVHNKERKFLYSKKIQTSLDI